MALKRARGPQGEVVAPERDSRILRGNPLGFRAPFNLETGESLPQRLRAWQRDDPVLR